MSEQQPSNGPTLLRRLLEHNQPILEQLGIALSLEEEQQNTRKSRLNLLGYVLATAQLLALDADATDELLAGYGQPTLAKLHQRDDQLLDQLLACWFASKAQPLVVNLGVLPPSEQATMPLLAQQALAFLGVGIELTPRQPGAASHHEQLLYVFRLAAQVASKALFTAKLRHAQYYIALIAEAEQQFRRGGNGILTGLAVFDQERLNLDLARSWLQSQAESDQTKTLDKLLIADASANAHMGDLRYAKRSDRIPQLEHALIAAHRLEERAFQGVLLNNLGIVYRQLGETRHALAFFKQAITIARETGNCLGEGQILANLGNAYRQQGELRRAMVFFKQAITIARKTGDRLTEGSILTNQGITCMDLGEPHRAIVFLEQALTIACETGDRLTEGSALSNLGNAYRDLGEPRRTITFLDQALAINRETGDRIGEGQTLGSLGNAYGDLGETRQAITFLEQHLAIARETGNRIGESEALGNLGNAYRDLGETRHAITFLEQHLAIAREIDDRLGEGGSLGNLGNAYLDLGQIRRAIAFFEQHLTIAREIGDQQGIANSNWNMGLALLQKGDQAQAITHLKQGLSFYQQIHHPQSVNLAKTLEYIRRHGRLPNPQSASALPDDLPATVRTALEQRDKALLRAALEGLTLDKAQGVIMRLQELTVLGRGSNMPRLMQEFAPLLSAIAAATRGKQAQREQIKQVLSQLDQKGWQLTIPVGRIWNGERDADVLTTEVDPNSAMLVRRILELVESSEDTIVIRIGTPWLKVVAGLCRLLGQLVSRLSR
ncbi:MAG TPA: tetratricopeptide repeat protein [Roseiflexaceae bacterium]|nr:tetratricopeptide repeat protein [Roseiflexaceae bacterium]